MKVTEVYRCNVKTKTELPLFLSLIRAGFSYPMDDYLDKKLNLKEYLSRQGQGEFDGGGGNMVRRYSYCGQVA